MNVSLRPMTLGEILDSAIQLFKSNLSLFLGIGLFPAIVSVVQGIIAENSRAAASPFQIASSFVYALGEGAACWATSRLLLSQSASVGSAYGAFSRRRGRLFGLSILQGLYAGWPVIPMVIILFALRETGVPYATWITIIALSIPCVVLFVRCALAFPATAVEDTFATASIKRSVELGRGHRWKVLWAVVLPIGVGFAVESGTLVLINWLQPSRSAFAQVDLVWFILRQANTLMWQTVFLPVNAIIATLTYYDLRVRKEGLDIIQMMEAAGLPGDLPVQASPENQGRYPSLEVQSPSTGTETAPQAATEDGGAGFQLR